MPVSIVFQLLAALLYATLGLWLWANTVKAQDGVRLNIMQRSIFAVAIAMHATGLFQVILPHKQIFLGWALAFSAAMCLGMLIFWLQSLRMRIDGLLLILLPAGAGVTLLACIFPVGHFVNHANSEWLRLHLLIAFSAYAITAVAAMHAILMTAIDRQLHRPINTINQQSALNQALKSMPPLLAQEQLLFKLISIGFVVLTLTVITGALVSIKISNTLVPFDHKTVFTLLSWITFGVLLWGRRQYGWRGRVALRWTLTGFAFVLLAYTGSRFVLDVLL